MKTLKFKPYFIEPLRSMKKISTIRKSDKEKFKNLFINYGFILEKTKYGFWITGVKE